MNSDKLRSRFPQASFGDNIIINCKNIIIGDNTVIKDNVFISSENVEIGNDCIIESDTQIKGIGQEMDFFFLGDNCFIGFRNQILVPSFIMLDYSQLHNSCLVSGYNLINIGYNCWIGQNTILNCTEKLKIGNNVRIGTQSQLWTHVASGELLEGCTLYGNKPLVLEDDVWIVGGAVISPGLVLKEKSIIMTGSVLTKNTDPKSTFAGVPAKDVTEKLSFWKDVTIDDKIDMMKKFIVEFESQNPEFIGRVVLKKDLNLSEIKTDKIYISNIQIPHNYTGPSLFDLRTKFYFKTRSSLEVTFIKFCLGFRARFIPTIINK